MIIARFLLLGESVVRDAETGQMSVFNMIEGITSPSFPLLFPKLDVLIMLERDKADPARGHGVLKAEVGADSVGEAKIDIDFEGNLRNRVVLALRGLIIPATGKLLFTFSVDGRQVAENYVDVVAATGVSEATTIGG